MQIVPDIRVSPHEVWATFILFVCLLLFVWVRLTNPKKINTLFSGFIRFNATEEKAINTDSIALFLIFVFSAVLLLMKGLDYHGYSSRLRQWEEFTLLSSILILYYIAKTIVLFICGNVFMVQAKARDYIAEIYATTHITALGLFPAAIMVTFSDNINENLVEKCLLAILGLVFFYRTIKMFILMMNRGLSVMYLFLYLCAVEIIPLVLLVELSKGINL